MEARHLIGVHVSTAGGLPQAVYRAQQLGCTAFQLFTANARQWALNSVEGETAATFRRACQETGIAAVVAHAGYLLNIASPNAELRRKSVAALEAECHRCQQLGIELVVLHPGSCPAEERRNGLRWAAEVLSYVAHNSTPILCIELTAGQGNSLGYSLEELAAIVELCTVPERLGICVDTCHALAAGYRLDTDEGYDAFWSRFSQLLGSERLRVLHLNDSLYPAGRRRDRHTHIGLGYCGIECFARLMNDPRWHNIPMIAETPKSADDTADRLNLCILKRLSRGEPVRPEEIRHLWRSHGTL